MTHLDPQIKRLREDIQCGGKIGPKSALRLLELVEHMTYELNNLKHHVRTLERQQREIMKRPIMRDE